MPRLCRLHQTNTIHHVPVTPTMRERPTMRLAVGGDHAAFEGAIPYKAAIIEHLRGKGHEILDCGTDGPDPVDYPDFAGKVCRALQNGEAERGVLICGTGIGIGMAANRYKGIRAAPCVTVDAARLSRTHNDSNVICLGRRLIDLETCIELIDIWLDTEFSGAEPLAGEVFGEAREGGMRFGLRRPG